MSNPTPEPAPLNIFQRIHAVMGEVDYVKKDKKDGMNYTITSHDKVTALVRPVLHKHGVIYYPHSMVRGQNGNRTEIDFKVRFQNIDDRADFIDVDTAGYGVDSQDKGVGKAISYGVKYALLKALGLETGDDPDLENRQHHPDDPKAGEKYVANASAWINEQTRADVIHAEWTKEFDNLMALPPALQAQLTKVRDDRLRAIAKPASEAPAPSDASVDWKAVAQGWKDDIDAAISWHDIDALLKSKQFAELTAFNKAGAAFLKDRAEKRIGVIQQAPARR